MISAARRNQPCASPAARSGEPSATPGFGEAGAIGLLQEMSRGFNEDDGFFDLTRFDGQKIRIFDGKVVPAI